MRLFTAILLPPDTLLRLERLLSALRPEALINWSPLDNLHITTKFIGTWNPDRFAELDSALAGIAPRSPFQIQLRHLNWFPNALSPRVLSAGVDGGPALTGLADEIAQRLLSLGIVKEDRPFSPHLTLARIRQPVPLERLREKVEELQSSDLGNFEARHFSLFRSDPGSNASIYRTLREYAFAAEPPVSQATAAS
jgi:RNA 2',3'-cyclic 3'-phosphodiesterase